ncbi:hypothetical protein [Haloechinothrix sp. LS1_15]|uniref:hypothetical protein n=1 Tax=Haloechinothrix sp. LS1_15 TaxID=2652248 RepID=UPI00294684CD|nr:hypothetical protein [Haloechinothrix sp. LS1_15]MDV6011059.1 hypothetical protein [Haloechinothrix sp. LS1_15]
MFGTVSVEYDEQLNDELTNLREAGESKPFKEVFPGDWDQAHGIVGPTTEEHINEITGLDVELRGSGIYRDSFMNDGNLIIFTSGDVVRMVSTGKRHVFPHGTVPPDAVLQGEPDPGRIRIVDPDG